MEQLENHRHARVRYSSRPTAANLPPANTNVETMAAHDVRALRALVDEALQNDQVPDAQTLDYIRLQERAQARLEAVEAREQYLQARVPETAKNATTGHQNAPAYVRSVGDSHSAAASRFSVSRAILTAYEGRNFDGVEAEVIQEGRRSNPNARGQVVVPAWALNSERRNIYGNTVEGGVTVAASGRQTLSAPMLTANHGVPVLQTLGATVLDASGASTFLVPFLGRTAASSTTEGTSATSSATFSELSLTPTRYTRRTDVTALALRTNGSAIDQVLLADFEAAHAWALDVHGFAAIKSGATFTKATETGTDDLAATTLANIYDLAADVLTATRTNETPALLCSPLAWEIVNTKVNTDLNQTLAQAYATSAGGRFVAAVGMVDGDIPAEKALASVANGKEFVGAGLIAGGYFPDLILARWGAGVDLLVDPYADADAGVIRVVSNSYVAAGIVRDSFRCLAVASADIADTAV